jgi:hypothetical protein
VIPVLVRTLATPEQRDDLLLPVDGIAPAGGDR